MKYIRLRVGPDEDAVGSPTKRAAARLLVRGLSLIIPRANPDIDDALYERVVEWWLELDDSTLAAEREIGFDRSGQPIVLGPVGRNMGVMTDNVGPFDEHDPQMELAQVFDEVWRSLLTEKFLHLADDDDLPGAASRSDPYRAD